MRLVLLIGLCLLNVLFVSCQDQQLSDPFRKPYEPFDPYSYATDDNPDSWFSPDKIGKYYSGGYGFTVDFVDAYDSDSESNFNLKVLASQDGKSPNWRIVTNMGNNNEYVNCKVEDDKWFAQGQNFYDGDAVCNCHMLYTIEANTYPPDSDVPVPSGFYYVTKRQFVATADKKQKNFIYHVRAYLCDLKYCCDNPSPTTTTIDPPSTIPIVSSEATTEYTTTALISTTASTSTMPTTVTTEAVTTSARATPTTTTASTTTTPLMTTTIPATVQVTTRATSSSATRITTGISGNMQDQTMNVTTVNLMDNITAAETMETLPDVAVKGREVDESKSTTGRTKNATLMSNTTEDTWIPSISSWQYSIVLTAAAITLFIAGTIWIAVTKCFLGREQ
ncbi:uncharacterized protein LOC129586937 isoform X2 [Paramacrobiotus metropolitanus]|uniref:uncharacterized protein LOC129586937 isoform X2 n=1 Tax=Paramacrobiotus metropolitanus TaxID=2943436 RepID=UPI002445C35F|nr:uncharacterized protein LOC129586937 isoform X2 [Paramacrobiotus metropolitanus]